MGLLGNSDVLGHKLANVTEKPFFAFGCVVRACYCSWAKSMSRGQQSSHSVLNLDGFYCYDGFTMRGWEKLCELGRHEFEDEFKTE